MDHSSNKIDLLEVGKVNKPHGLDGKVVVSLSTNLIDERTKVGAEFLVEKNSETRFLICKEAKDFNKKWLFKFEGIEDKDSAFQISGLTLYAEPVDNPEALYLNLMIGKDLFDQHGTNHGPIARIVANPAADLLELENGVLVPTTFVVSEDELTVVVDVPKGLL